MTGQQSNPDKPRGTAADAPLPPIPDGGLTTSMPDWLRTPPPAAPAAPPVIGTSDPAGFISEDDLPTWLRSLSQEASPSVRSPAQPPVAPVPAAPPAQHDPGVRNEGPPADLGRGSPPSDLSAAPRDHRLAVGIVGGALLLLVVLLSLYVGGL